MSSPVLHLVAGPNGAGKSTFVARVLQPVTHLPVINADAIAARQWPDATVEHAHAAAALAATERRELMAQRASFITETVFSHLSKMELVEQALARGYLAHLHVVMVPVDLSVRRVAERVRRGGHDVPEDKVRARHQRLWPLVAEAAAVSERADFYDNSVADRPFHRVAHYERGKAVGPALWPGWAPIHLAR
ncbi:MAG: zeta toxin family protein [Actinomycetia bacterium]|nr:zeta toxin family protein [Actinomycetes bacterium]